MDQDNVRIIRALEKERDYWKAKAQENWDLVETVSLGEKLYCDTCKRYHPCACDGEKS